MRTITAIATPQGVGGIGIIRISGKEALTVLERVFKPFSGSFTARKMELGRLDAGEIKDRALAVYFPAPNSFTGEEVAELHLHGGRFLMQKALQAVVEAGATLAMPGEFTQRAFLNGKIALSDAEGIADMINADSESALRSAYRLMSGELARTVRALNERLLVTTASIEVAFDYPEEMMDDLDVDAIRADLAYVRNEVDKLISSASRGKMIKDGISVAIVGATNAGKSSLLNRILRYDRAIVSDVPGTTRDTVEESVVYKGVKFNIVDTAGIRDSSDEIESIGIDRSRRAAKGADCIVYVVDGAKAVDDDERALMAEFLGDNTVLVVNKSDLGTVCDLEGIQVSAKTGEGVDDVMDAVLNKCSMTSEDTSLITSVRHEDALVRARTALDNALSGLGVLAHDCVAVDVRSAYFALGEITGESSSEEITHTVFTKFCVGK